MVFIDYCRFFCPSLGLLGKDGDKCFIRLLKVIRESGKVQYVYFFSNDRAILNLSFYVLLDIFNLEIASTISMLGDSAGIHHLISSKLLNLSFHIGILVRFFNRTIRRATQRPVFFQETLIFCSFKLDSKASQHCHMPSYILDTT